MTAVQTTFGDGNPAGSEDITFGLETELLVFGADLPPSAQSGVVVGAVSSGVVDTTVVTEDVIGKQGGGSAPSQFITTELYAATKEATRGFIDYLVNTGQPIPVGAINDNNAPLSYGDTRIYGFYHTVSTFSGNEYTNLVIANDGVHADEGWTSVTINGVTYQRDVASTSFTTSTIGVSGGGTTSAHIFTFTNTSLAASGFNETDGTKLAITWVI